MSSKNMRAWVATAAALLLAACMQQAAQDAPAARPAPPPAPEPVRQSGPTAPPTRSDEPMRAPASSEPAEASEAAPTPMPAPMPAPRPARTSSSQRLPTAVGRSPAAPAAPAEPATTTPDEAPPPPAASKAEDYSIAISATRELKLPGPPGKLSIWIGLTSRTPAIGSEDVGASKPLREAGRTAKITPIALGMDTDPPTGCLKIDPDGSEKIFQLKPRSRGRFQVGASVELFNSDDCSGTPVPKSSDLITVEVKVG